TFSPDSRRLGYFAKQDETWYLVINDSQVTTIEDQDGPLGLVLEGRGGYAFSVFEGSVYRLAPGAGESNEPEQGKDYTWVETLFLSPDGARVAYLARTYASRVRAYESWAMVIDGNEDPEFTEVFSQSFRFSPNSRHYAYVAASIHADELGYQVVLDGQPTQRYTGLVKGGPNFNSDGTLEFLAMRSDTLYKVVLSPDEK
ncbi:MAG: hypothetical protein ABIK62_07330, partial [candidate division WOR-3 bacterium]